MKIHVTRRITYTKIRNTNENKQYDIKQKIKIEYRQ